MPPDVNSSLSVNIIDTSNGEVPSKEERVLPSRVNASLWTKLEVKSEAGMNGSASGEVGGEAAVRVEVSEDTTGPHAAESRRVMDPRRG